MKYVMLKKTTAGVEQYIPIIFPQGLVHRDVALALRRMEGGRGAEVASAGFYNLATGKCYGESESLGAKSHPNDDAIIDTWDYVRGIGIRYEESDVGYEATKL